MQQAADYSRGVLYEGGVWAPSTIQGQTADAAKCPDIWPIRILLSRHFTTGTMYVKQSQVAVRLLLAIV